MSNRFLTLAELLVDLRHELGQSTANVSGDVRLEQIHHINYAQQELWDNHEWPHLRVWADAKLNPGQRYYDWPMVDTLRERQPQRRVDPKGVIQVVLRDHRDWHSLEKGVDPLAYDVYDSDRGERCESERTDTPWRWDIHREDQFEVWPIPDNRCQLVRVVAKCPLVDMVDDNDRCQIDPTLLVIRAASRAAKDEKTKAILSNRAKRLEDRVKAGLQQGGTAWNAVTSDRLYQPRPTEIRYAKR